ncbi:low-density lipoprotein receptor-related protein 1B-like [Antedon mediterranea]|uniref:low-density lipoprotein receptor-related protein 1B-like n=1 Tax=Antedon mediterranea TaxID=105859 RepID=UPI003AF56CB1
MEVSNPAISSGHNFTSVAADYDTGNLTFHDARSHWLYLSDDLMEPGGQASPIEGGTSGRVDGVTIDWLAQNVYWVDEGYNWIKMMNYSGGVYTVIADTGIERPSGIACHPSKAYLFWTELGNLYSPKIERSSMSGGNRITIITNVTVPRAIAVDVTTDRIYWIDETSTESRIESSDVDGNDRRVEVTQSLSLGMFDSISVDQDYIYVSVYSNDDTKLLFYTKTIPSSKVFEHSFGGSIRIYDLCVTGSEVQPKPMTLPCDYDTCHHYCVSAAENNHECICIDDYNLLSNGTCIDDSRGFNPPFGVIGRPGAVSQFEPRLLHYSLQDKQRFVSDIYKGNIQVTSVAVDFHSNYLFYADDISKNIIYGSLVVGSHTSVLHQGIGRVEGMAVDWVSKNLYWVDYNTNHLMYWPYSLMIPITLFEDVINAR